MRGNDCRLDRGGTATSRWPSLQVMPSGYAYPNSFEQSLSQLVDTRGFFDPLLQLLVSAIEERFMDERHHDMWQVIAQPEQCAEAFATAHPWSPDARNFATQ